MFANSSVDRWLSHATYGGGWHDTAPSIGPGGEVWTLKQMSAVGAKVIGVPAFSVGVKGGFSPPLLPLNKSAAKGLNCSESGIASLIRAGVRETFRYCGFLPYKQGMHILCIMPYMTQYGGMARII